MLTNRTLARSIALNCVSLILLQSAIMAAVMLGYGVSWRRFALFWGITLAYHAGMTAILLARRADFHIDGSDVMLPRVNISNSLTLGRLSSIPTIVFLIVQSSDSPVLPVLLPLLALVFATDMLDGMFARRRGEITFVGRYLDSSSDYLMIIAVSIVFFYFELIPLWFFILVMGRLILFAVGMAMLSLREGKANPLATFLGKASIFALMVLYVLEIAELLNVRWIGNHTVVIVVEYITAAVVAVSIVDKAIFLARGFAKAPPRQSRRPRAGGSA
jgi:phosphatidylglycerophosphate synthase